MTGAGDVPVRGRRPGSIAAREPAGRPQPCLDVPRAAGRPGLDGGRAGGEAGHRPLHRERAPEPAGRGRPARGATAGPAPLPAAREPQVAPAPRGPGRRRRPAGRPSSLRTVRASRSSQRRARATTIWPGRLGVSLYQGLVARSCSDEHGLTLTPAGRAWFAELAGEDALSRAARVRCCAPASTSPSAGPTSGARSAPCLQRVIRRDGWCDRARTGRSSSPSGARPRSRRSSASGACRWRRGSAGTDQAGPSSRAAASDRLAPIPASVRRAHQHRGRGDQPRIERRVAPPLVVSHQSSIAVVIAAMLHCSPDGEQRLQTEARRRQVESSRRRRRRSHPADEAAATDAGPGDEGHPVCHVAAVPLCLPSRSAQARRPPVARALAAVTRCCRRRAGGSAPASREERACEGRKRDRDGGEHACSAHQRRQLEDRERNRRRRPVSRCRVRLRVWTPADDRPARTTHAHVQSTSTHPTSARSCDRARPGAGPCEPLMPAALRTTSRRAFHGTRSRGELATISSSSSAP